MTSRVLGLVREQVMAYLFGAGNAVDAFNVAFRIPNLVRDLFAEGAMSAAFIPTFTKYLARDGRAAAWRLGSNVINALLLAQARFGRTVVRLKGGDPFVFGRGSEEAAACREAGVPVYVVPGVSSTAPGRCSSARSVTPAHVSG